MKPEECGEFFWHFELSAAEYGALLSNEWKWNKWYKYVTDLVFFFKFK